MTLHDPAGFDGPPHQELELRSAAALARGDIAQAFAFADRRCRQQQVADAHCYVLRAEALRAMGDNAAALDDLGVALAIAPDDLAANRRMVAWGEGDVRRRAARALIRHARDPAMVRQAVAVLREDGADCFGMLQCHGDVIEGWAIWPGNEGLSVFVTSPAGSCNLIIEADPSHPLASPAGQAADIRLALRSLGKPAEVALTHGDTVFARLQVGTVADADVQQSGADPAAPDADVTVIVPVYGDARATLRCFQSLLPELTGDRRYQVIVVDDASPDPLITLLLAQIEQEAGVTVLRNSSNLGFVGAVNRALATIARGDVILLNADTVVPPGFIGRLTAAARLAPDIGTVTPLSNNGEFTSFPVPNRANSAGSILDVWRIDDIAARVNAGRVVDLPNGIGFCLYVTRACLDAVGTLSASYDRGYLEEVDFCLRARQRGFRNVCAPSVYVGHAGSRSFGTEKRALVVRNVAVVEHKYPHYRRECADFLLADPLKAARRSIERELGLAHGATLVVVCGDGAVAEIAAARARHLVALEASAVMLQVRAGPEGTLVTLRDAGAGAPQSLDFMLSKPDERAALGALLSRAGLDRIELFDLARLRPALLDTLLSLGVPYDLGISHDGLGIGERDAAEIACGRIARQAGGLLAPDFPSAVVAERLGLGLPCWKLDLGLPEPVPGPEATAPAARLALLPLRKDVAEIAFIRALAAGLRRCCPDVDLLVMGELPAGGEVAGLTATGAIAADELAEALRHHGVDRILSCERRPLFGHPLAAAARATPLPVAAPDWAGACCYGRAGDLGLAPALAADAVVDALLPWLRGQEIA